MNRATGDNDDRQPRQDRSERPERRSDEVIDREVRELLKTGRSTLSASDISRVHERIKDPKLAEVVQDAWAEKQEEIQERSKDIAQKIIEKFGNNTPYHRIIDFMNKYRNKHKLDDITWHALQRQVQLRLQGVDVDRTFERTNIARALGHTSTDIPDGLRVEEKDYKHVENITRRFEETRDLFDTVKYQTITYRDCAMEAITGEFDRNKHATLQHVHPLIAALFLPKIQLLEQQCLLANIGAIVKAKRDRKAIRDPANWMLYHCMVQDPADVVCSEESPMADLAKRYEVQQRLIETVLSLRNGLYYTPSAGHLIRSLESCRISGIDNPELAFSQDEGALMRRFMSVFSLRPTLIRASTPAVLLGTSPFDRMISAPKMSHTSMLMLRLSPYMPAQAPIDVSMALRSSAMVWDGAQFTQRTQEVHSSYNLLVINVARRMQNVVHNQYSQPFSFTALPVSATGMEQLIDREVAVGQHLQLADGSSFRLRSAVAVERTTIPSTGSQIICGTSAVIVKQNDTESGGGEMYLYYNPGVSRFRVRMSIPGKSGDFNQIPPVTAIPLTDTPLADGTVPENFTDIVNKRSTVLIYTHA
jgi:urease beta subunit